jgi:integrase
MNKSYPKTLNKRGELPSLADLEQIREKAKNIKNKQGEVKRKVHYGCYLLCSESGLRISEAVRFDLKAKTKKGLYRIEKPKGKKERYVYVSQEVIQELKKQNWKPHQTNR